MLGGPRFTPVVSLQVEILASTMKCRDMKNKPTMVGLWTAEGCSGGDGAGREWWMDEASGGVYACSCSEPCRTDKN